ncbi:LLM class flavin-dependent oxidoreductase [Kibdelosporangium philippinense]|uniref:LLM class flavin-dependent oxidoreductase n=1 Tax=Kibdelosporangium philippinense TaxID=211113 RepID=A0ABS8Z245_9PSEU|nr:LLM class flavin-dependent oxidoreductase [Kibdelosporangium philippinense]MCE7002009.1 LLM class flavin-dependent oxidoreductase [Kibdelosporangium philippinense]
MRFSVAIPQFATDPHEVRRFLHRAEDLGFECAWTQEQILGSKSVIGAKPVISPLELLAYAAACTERIRLGCAVFVTPLRNPVHLAKSISSLDQLSGGRIDVGVGIGGKKQPFAAFDSSPEHLVTRFTEGLEVMKRLRTEPSVTFDGKFWQLEDGQMEPKPVQRPYPPIWFGANHPNAVRRAVKLGDGFIGAGSATTARFVDLVKIAREAMVEFDRPDFKFAKRVYVALDDNVERAHARTGEMLESFYNRGDITSVAVYGTAHDVIRGLGEVADAGAESIVLNPMFDEHEQLEQLITDVIPQLS